MCLLLAICDIMSVLRIIKDREHTAVFEQLSSANNDQLENGGLLSGVENEY